MELIKLIEDLALREQEYEAASKEEAQARNRRTDCLNRLNAAQKAVDKAVDDMRKKAQVGSDWQAGRVTRHLEVKVQ